VGFGVLCLFFLGLLFVSDRKFLFETFGGVTLLWFVSPAKGWPDFHLFPIFFMSDLRFFVDFGETRTPQTCSSSHFGLSVPCISRSGQQ
jgi:hypothetical protein